MENSEREPWIDIGEDTESLIGNRAGLALLRDTLNRLPEGDELTMDVDADSLFRTVELGEKSDTSTASSNPLLSFSCLFVVVACLLASLAFAVAGFLQFINFIF